MMEISANALRWSTDVGWTIDARHGKQPRVIFLRGRNPLLILDVASPVVEFLETKRSPSDGEHLPDLPPAFAPLLHLLQERRILVSDSPITAKVQFFGDAQTVLHTCTVQSVRRRRIDLLVGDEKSLHRNHAAFVATRDAGVFLGTVCMAVDRIDVGPLRLPHEALAPPQRELFPQTYPRWRERLRHVLGMLEELLADACQGPSWFALTARGMRLPLRWEEATYSYEMEMAPLTAPNGCIPLHYARARVENSLLSGGTGERAIDAELAARGEAWERFCMGRCDMATAAPDDVRARYADWSGVSTDYLCSLAQPLPAGPPECVAWVHNAQVDDPKGSLLRMPTHWVYFQNGTAGVTNTSGAAYGRTLSDAIRSGTHELIERHALMRAYFLGVRGRQVPLEELEPSVHALVNLAPRHTARFYHLATINGAHVVVCVLAADTPPFMSLGAAARPTLSAAARKAFSEVASMDLEWARDIEKMGPKCFMERARALREAPPASVDLMEGARVWAGMPDAPSILDNLFAGGHLHPETMDPSRFVVVDIGARVVADAHVVKVMHPDALPLPSFHAHALHLAKRLDVNLTLPLPLA